MSAILGARNGQTVNQDSNEIKLLTKLTTMLLSIAVFRNAQK